VDLGVDRSVSVELRNTGNVDLGPIDLTATVVRDAAGNALPGAAVRIAPQTVPTLTPDQSATIALDIDLGSDAQAGAYSSELTAQAGLEADARVTVQLVVASDPFTEVAELSLTTTADALRQGDVFRFVAVARDAAGVELPEVEPVWSVSPQSAGFVDAGGRFVGYANGPVTVTARAGSVSAAHSVTLSGRGIQGSATRVGEGSVSDRFTSDLWVHGDYAYTGTWGQRSSGTQVNDGDQLLTWDVRDPSAPTRTHALTVDARTVNDIKVRADGTLAVLTHEGSRDGLNGVTLLDLSDPAQPEPIGRFTEGLQTGIHNVWIEGDYAYLVLDGLGMGLRVLDIRDPAAPRVVASFYAGSSVLHDVYVRDGLAFLSHWDAGLVILDVGHGIAGGSPENPVEVSRIPNMGGQTHNAWYWPEAGYVFVGEEDFGTPGIMRVVDASDLTAPKVAATFQTPAVTPHNFWLDETKGVLYLAWYENGLRALDVTGTLMGELDRQGREYFGELYDGAGTGCASADGTCSWAPQLHRGLVFVSDMNNGLVVLNPGT